jgi:hypothetical protein
MGNSTQSADTLELQPVPVPPMADLTKLERLGLFDQLDTMGNTTEPEHLSLQVQMLSRAVLLLSSMQSQLENRIEQLEAANDDDNYHE